MGTERPRRCLGSIRGSVQGNPAPSRQVDNLAAIKLAEIPDELVVSNEAFSIAIDHESGSISSYNVGGRELLTSPLEPNYWRAPTDNDRGNQMSRRAGQSGRSRPCTAR